jgi:hypothetical protein
VRAGAHAGTIGEDGHALAFADPDDAVDAGEIHNSSPVGSVTTWMFTP